MITPAFKILEPGNNTRAIGGQLPWLSEWIAIGIGNAETAAIEPDYSQTILFDESLHVLPSPVSTASWPFQTYEIATFACYGT